MRPDTKQRVLEAIKVAHPQELLPREVAERAGVTRQTASVKLQILEAEGKVEVVRRLGPALWYRYKG